MTAAEPGSPRSLARRGIAVLVGVVLVLAIIAANRLNPEIEQRLRPIARTGGIGQQVQTGLFTFRVDRIELTRTVVPPRTALVRRPQPTRGVWVVVHATAVATREPVRLATTVLHTPGGFTYDASQRLGMFNETTLDQVELAPGLPRAGAILFEIAPRHLAGASLQVEPAKGLVDTNWLGYAARIDLDIDQAEADALVRGMHPRLNLKAPGYL